MTSIKFSLLLFLLLAAGTSVRGEEGKQGERPLASFSLSYSNGPWKEREKEGNTKADLTLQIPLLFRPDRFLLSLPLSVTSARWESPLFENSPEETLLVSGGLRAAFFLPGGSTLGISASGSSHLQKGSSREIRFSRGFLLYTLPGPPCLTWLAGASYQPLRGDYPVPLGGLRWEPQEKIRLQLLLPFRIEAVYSPLEELSFTLSLGFHEDTMEISEGETYALGELALTGSLEWFFTENLSFTGSAGMNLLREEALESESVRQENRTVPGGPVFAGALKFYP